MKTIVTGAAGFVGYHLSKFLSEQGKELILIDNFERSKIDEEFRELIDSRNIKFIDIDITEKEAFSSIDDEVSEVYHLAAINGTENFYKIPDKVLTVNIVGTLNLLEWAKNKPEVKILFSSSSEVYAGAHKLGLGKIPSDESIPVCIDDISNIRFSYGASKALSENAFFAYAARYSLRFSIIRYHNIYGPRMGFSHVIPQLYERIFEGENPLTVYGCDQTRAFCYISDAIRASQLVMESSSMDGKIVHIGNDREEIRIIDLAKMILDITSSPFCISRKPSPEGSVDRRCPDITRLKSMGYFPEVSLRSGLERTKEWYQKY